MRWFRIFGRLPSPTGGDGQENFQFSCTEFFQNSVGRDALIRPVAPALVRSSLANRMARFETT